MRNYSDDTYGERVAHVYDDWYTKIDDGAIDLLSELAGDGPALELGIGTGRFVGVALGAHPAGDRTRVTF